MGTSNDEDAIQLDLYLDRVLAGDASVDPGRPDPAFAGPDGGPEALSRAISAVASGATRIHPSFRFEERLAGRLRDAAVGLDRQAAVAGGVVVPFAPGKDPVRARSRRVGGVLVGGAIASGVSIASIAGAAALVVWRRARWERLV